MAIRGLHCRHVGGQNKRKFTHIILHKTGVNFQRRIILLFHTTDMAAMTSRAINLYYKWPPTWPSLALSRVRFLRLKIVWLPWVTPSISRRRNRITCQITWFCCYGTNGKEAHGTFPTTNKSIKYISREPPPMLKTNVIILHLSSKLRNLVI